MPKYFLEKSWSYHRSSVTLIVTCVLAVVILYLTLTKTDQSTAFDQVSDKVHHFFAFAILVFPAALTNRKILGWVLPASVILGGIIELIQPHVGRQGEWLDFVADFSGAIFGALLGLALKSALFKKNK